MLWLYHYIFYSVKSVEGKIRNEFYSLRSCDWFNFALCCSSCSCPHEGGLSFASKGHSHPVITQYTAMPNNVRECGPNLIAHLGGREGTDLGFVSDPFFLLSLRVLCVCVCVS